MGKTSRTIEDLVFNSQKEALDYFKDILARSSPGALQGRTESRILYFIVAVYKDGEKLSNGFCGFYIEESSFRKKSFFVKTDNGTLVDFSYIKAIRYFFSEDQSCTNDSIKIQNFKSAARHSIMDQKFIILDQAKNNEQLICPECGNDIASNCNLEPHIDHGNFGFDRLLFDFVTERDLFISDFSIERLPDGENRKLTGNLATEWANYHRQNVDWKIVCSTCNLSRKRGQRLDWKSRLQRN